MAQQLQKGLANPYYEHVKYNPYLIYNTRRLSTPNPYYKRQD